MVVLLLSVSVAAPPATCGASKQPAFQCALEDGSTAMVCAGVDAVTLLRGGSGPIELTKRPAEILHDWAFPDDGRMRRSLWFRGAEGLSYELWSSMDDDNARIGGLNITSASGTARHQCLADPKMLWPLQGSTPKVGDLCGNEPVVFSCALNTGQLASLCGDSHGATFRTEGVTYSGKGFYGGAMSSYDATAYELGWSDGGREFRIGSYSGMFSLSASVTIDGVEFPCRDGFRGVPKVDRSLMRGERTP